MPKKTKKQKIIAQYHRKLKLLENQPSPVFSQEKKVVEKPKKEELERTIAPEPVKNNYFLADFKKSLFLTAAIITLEILFYFATIKNYLRLN